MKELRRLEAMYSASLYAIILIPFLMIVIGGGLGPFMAVTFLPILIGSFFFNRAGLAKVEHNKWWNAVIIFFIVYAGVDLAVLGSTVISVGLRMVLVLTLIKLYSRLSDRDDLQVYALSFMMLAAATTVNEDLSFGLLFGVYVLIGTFSLAVFHLRAELLSRPRILLRTTLPINARYVGVLVAISGLILAMSVVIFFTFPRLGRGFFELQAREGISVTGFSEEVELGGHGVIRTNPQVVMRVEFLDGRPPGAEGFHWRAMSFDHYDGLRWSQKARGSEIFLPRKKSTFEIREYHPTFGDGRMRLQVYLEPLGTNLVPVLWPTDTIRLGTEQFVMPWGPDSGDITVDGLGDLRHTVENELGLQYVMTVRGGPPTQPRPPVPSRIDARVKNDPYLQLPPTSDETRKLGRDIARPFTHPTDVAEAVQNHLATLTYTTDLPKVGEDPVHSFLFETKRGHCEYFATSAVVLMRIGGVRARLVNGFLGGAWNGVGDYWAVRQGDAHTWVEYEIPGLGWVPIDPTPPSSSPIEPDIFNSAREVWDAWRLQWMKWVIEYDLSAQIQAFRDVGRMLIPKGLMQGTGGPPRPDESTDEEDGLSMRVILTWVGLFVICVFANRRTRRSIRRNSHWVRMLAGGVVLVALGAIWLGWFEGFEVAICSGGGGAVALAIGVAFVGRRDLSASRSLRIRATFNRIADEGAKAGTKRQTSEGPAEYLDRLALAAGALAEPMGEFRHLYLKARFSEADADIEALEDLAAQICGGLRSGGRRVR